MHGAGRNVNKYCREGYVSMLVAAVQLSTFSTL